MTCHDYPPTSSTLDNGGCREVKSSPPKTSSNHKTNIYVMNFHHISRCNKKDSMSWCWLGFKRHGLIVTCPIVTIYLLSL